MSCSRLLSAYSLFISLCRVACPMNLVFIVLRLGSIRAQLASGSPCLVSSRRLADCEPTLSRPASSAPHPMVVLRRSYNPGECWLRRVS